MKEYAVDIDVTIGVCLYVKAESEEEAKKKAQMQVCLDPMYEAYHKGNLVSVDIVDVYEEDGE